MEELFALDSGSPFTEDLLKEYLDDRKLVLNDKVSADILEAIGLNILKWNKEDKDIPKEKRKPIWIYIQSPGGNVIYGHNIIDIIESSITPVYTVCFAQCASMAFHIFISGHKRFCFKNSILLMHEGESGVCNTSSKVKDTMKFFELMENRLKDHVLKHTVITSELYDEVYTKEFYIYADDKGKELGCVDYIIGEDVTINEVI